MSRSPSSPFRAAPVPAALVAALLAVLPAARPAGSGAEARFSVAPAGTAAAPAGPEGVLHRYALDGPIPTVPLPRFLDEISGLAFDDRGRLWAHDDEVARIYELDPVSGDPRSSFDVGRPGWTLGGDWEGIAWAEGRFFLVDSDGVLLEFRAGAPGERVPYRRIATGLGRRCEIEGLGFDPSDRTLLLGCKTPRERALRGRIVLLAFSLVTMGPEETPRVLTPTAGVQGLGGRDDFAASAVEVHPVTGTLLVAAARGRSVVELAPDGRVLAARRIAEGSLRQVEGLAVGRDGVLFLASEGDGGRPRLARLPLREVGGGGEG